MTDRTGGAEVPGRTAAHAYLCLAFTSVCFGANTTFAKLVVGEVSPMMVVALRWLLVVVLLVAFNRKSLARDWPYLRPHLGFLFAMGALGFATFNGLFYIAAHFTTAVNMGIIQGVLPVFVLVGAWLAFRTPSRGLQDPPASPLRSTRKSTSALPVAAWRSLTWPTRCPPATAMTR